MSRKTFPSYDSETKDQNSNTEKCEERNGQRTASADDRVPGTNANEEPGRQFGEGQGHGKVYDYAANLPMEFYHYYYGSNTDMGTLIEVISVTICALPLLQMLCHNVFLCYSQIWETYICIVQRNGL